MSTITPTPQRKSQLPFVVGAAVILIAVLAWAVWLFVFRDNSAADVGSAEAEEARQEALEEAGVGAGDGGAADITGTWTVDTTIGSFDQRCLVEVCDTTFVGFRIDEELATIGAKTVVGRSPGVTGTMVIDGTMLTATDIVVDMTQLITDDPSRTNAIRNQAIETAAFPEASFRLTQPIDLGTVPGPGEEVAVEATGELTIHGVTRTETIPLTAQLQGDVIVVFGQLGPILLADYDIDQPRAAVVLSVEDNAIMELQLFLRRS